MDPLLLRDTPARLVAPQAAVHGWATSLPSATRLKPARCLGACVPSPSPSNLPSTFALPPVPPAPWRSAQNLIPSCASPQIRRNTQNYQTNSPRPCLKPARRHQLKQQSAEQVAALLLQRLIERAHRIQTARLNAPPPIDERRSIYESDTSTPATGYAARPQPENHPPNRSTVQPDSTPTIDPQICKTS